MTIACEDANSNLVGVITFADVDDKDRVGNSLLQIWKLRFDHKVKFLFLTTLFGQDLKLKFRHDFEAGVWSVFCR